MEKKANKKINYRKRLDSELFYDDISYGAIKKARKNTQRDYIFTQHIDGTNIIAGLGEIQGMREGQEDHLSVYSVDSFNLYSGKEQKKILQDTFAVMIKRYGSISACGSTACITIASRVKNSVHIVNANMGDSSSFIVILEPDRSGQYRPLSIKRINKVLHNMDEDPEWLSLNAGTIKRVGGNLAVTRGIGDEDIKELDLLYKNQYKHKNDPDIYVYHVSLRPKQVAFILQVCDGGTEKDFYEQPCLDENKIGEIISYYYTRRADYLDFLSETVFQLIKTAFNHQNDTHNGSQDNISMALIPIVMNEPPVMVLLFDGHGGDEVSNGLGRDFYPAFINILNKSV